MASCTRRLFKDLAAEYSAIRPPVGSDEHLVWEAMVSRTMAVLKRENANFNMEKFAEACAA